MRDTLREILAVCHRYKSVGQDITSRIIAACVNIMRVEIGDRRRWKVIQFLKTQFNQHNEFTLRATLCSAECRRKSTGKSERAAPNNRHHRVSLSCQKLPCTYDFDSVFRDRNR